MPQTQVLGAKVSAPRPPRYVLTRPRIDVLLQQALHYRLTLVQAGTGYGKTTALGSLSRWNIPLFWYSATEGDSDVYQFLAHLNAAFRRGLDTLPDVTLALSQEGPSPNQVLETLLNCLENLLRDNCVLVIDDYHLAASASVEALTQHFLAFLPNRLHVVLATRHVPCWQNLVVWRARGEVCEITSEMLAFTADEIETLFRTTYGLALSAENVGVLRERTEGWPIALQLVWQKMRANPATDLAKLLSQDSSLDTLFEFLAHQVIAKQPRQILNFMLQTAVLRELDADACDAITRRHNSAAHLKQLRENDLFIVSLGEGHYRYHHLELIPYGFTA